MQEQYKSKRKELSLALSAVVKDLKYQSNKSANLLANEVEISKTTILKIEKGELDLQLSTLCRVASSFGITPLKFFELIEKQLPKNWDIIDN